MRLFNSFIWSLLGNIVPMAAALLAVPFLLQTLGQERFGMLSLIWVVVGYFSFLDMGLGRAVTVAVAIAHAESLSKGKEGGADAEVIKIVATATGFLAAVALIAVTPAAAAIFIFGLPLNFSTPGLGDEAALALLWMLPSLPLLLMASSLRGYLEGVLAFRLLNMLRIPTGVMLVAGPCLTAWLWPSLVWATVSLFAVRLLHIVFLFWLVNWKMQSPTPVSRYRLRLEMRRNYSYSVLRRLFVFGGWATVSNLVGPLIVYIDRFVIAAVLGASAVAVYTVPFDVVSRLPILVASVCSVLLPVMAQLSRRRSDLQQGNAVIEAEHQRTSVRQLERLFRRSSLFSAGAVAPLVICGWLAAPWGLRWWLGEALSPDAIPLAQVLLVAFGVNAMAQIPFTALQAARRVKSVAVLHLCQLLPYTGLVYLAVSHWGLAGAAYAWLFRGLADYFLLTFLWLSHAATLRRDGDFHR